MESSSVIHKDYDFEKGLTNVPDDPRAKLMFYLNCISYLLDMDTDTDMQHYTTYSNYLNLNSVEDKRKILSLCRTANPSILLDKCIFYGTSEELGELSNRFFSVNRIDLMFVSNVIIEGAHLNVNRLMVIDHQWLKRNFFLPFEKLSSE